MRKKVIGYLIGWKLAIYAVAIAALSVIPLGDQFYNIKATFKAKLPYLVWVWGNYDGAHYIEIARRGYQSFEFGFFPLFPVFIRLTRDIARLPYVPSALLISHVSFILGLCVVYKLLIIDKKISLLPLVLLVILIFPTSMFYQAVYNDSFFFLLACLCLYFGRRKKWIIASVCGAFAALARLNGLALAFFILFEYLGDRPSIWREKLKLKNIWKSKIFMGILIPLAFGGYLLYINIVSKSWITLFSHMKEWHQDKVIFPLQVLWRYLKIFATVQPVHFNFWVAALEFLSVMFYMLLIVWSYKKIRLSYWIFFAVSILIPSLTGTFQGMPRYGLHLYPLFLAIALFLEKKGLAMKIVYFVIGILLSLFYISFFTRGYFVA